MRRKLLLAAGALLLFGVAWAASRVTYDRSYAQDRADRRPYVGGYGHLEDELRRVDGRWLISHHRVFNEQRENMAAPGANPAW